MSEKFEFTFNSCKYLKDFDISEVEKIEAKPFMMLDVVGQLLYGAMNKDPKKPVKYEEVEKYITNYMKDKPIVTLLEDLMSALEECDFFKSLQMAQVKSPTIVE